MSLAIVVSGLGPALLAKDRNTHLPDWAQNMSSCLLGELLLETSNFTDHGFGEKICHPRSEWEIIHFWRDRNVKLDWSGLKLDSQAAL